MTGTSNTKALTWFALLASLYASINIISNVSSARIVSIAGLSIDAGTLAFPLTFVMRDLVHKVAGTSMARRVVVIAATLSALGSLVFWIVGVLPPDLNVGPQEEFRQVLAITWRIAVAGVIAQLVSELIDTEIYALWQRKFGERLQIGRVLSSNAISIPTDSIVFTAIAFTGVYSFDVLVGIAFGNIVLKFAITAIFSPAIKFMPKLPSVV